MRFQITLILLLLTKLTFCQSWYPQYELFFKQVEEQTYDKAIETGSNLLGELEKIKKTDTAYSNVAYYIAYIQFNSKEYEQAAIFAQKQRDGIKSYMGNEALPYLAATYFQGISYGYQTKYDLAIPLMQEVVTTIKKNYGTEHDYYIHYSNQLANTLNAAGAYFKADEIYSQNYAFIKSKYTDADSIYRVMANAISTFYTATGNYEKSEPFFLQSLMMLEKNYGKTSEYYITTLNSLGEFYLMAGWYDKAEKTYEEFVEVTETAYGKKSADYATAVNNLAVALEKQEKYEAAEKAYLKCLEIKESVWTKKSDYYALTLSNLCVLYDNMGKYALAEKYGTDAIKIYEEVYGPTSSNYATALSNLGSIYSSNGKNKEAEKLLTKSAELFTSILGENSAEYVYALNNLANIHVSAGEYEKAEKEFEKCIVIREKIQGAFHTELGTTLFNLANLKSELGNFVQAEELLNRALIIQRKANGKYGSEVASVLQSLASLYASTGRYLKAEATFKECKIIYEKTYGKLHPQYAVMLSNESLFYYKKGEYQKAEELLDQALKIQYNAFGEESPENIRPLSNLANLKIAKDNYKEAEKLLLWCNNTAKIKYGTNHPDYASTLNTLGSLYSELGNYSKAQKFYEEALILQKEIYGDKHAEYSNGLNNLGALYLNQASDAKTVKEIESLTLKAIVQFKKSMAIDSTIYGMDNIEISTAYNNLAEAYRTRNEADKAEKYYLQCLALEKKFGGENNAKTALTYHNMSLLYAGLNKLYKAEEYALQSLEIYNKNFGLNSPASSSAISSLAYIYELEGKNDKAEIQYEKALAIQQKAVEQNFTFLSEEEKEKYINTMSLYNNMYTAFALKTKSENKSITATVYNNELKNKGALLKSSSRMRNTIINSKDTTLVSLYTKWTDLKQQLSSLYATPVEKRTADLTKIENEANSLEKQLVEKSTEMKSMLNDSKVSFKEIKNKLLENQAAVEFTHFTRQDTSQQDVYCALIIRKDQEYPEIVQLFTATELNEIIGKHGANNLEYVSGVYAGTSKLHSLVWAPIEKYLIGVNEIYYSPSGLLHKLSFASIKSTDGKYLSDRYQLHALNSTASILQSNSLTLNPVKTHITMFGGVKYDTDKTKNVIWKYLPGTLSEANNINSITKKGGMMANSFTGIEATEKHLKELDGKNSPEILHVATHGFFFGDPEETKKQLVIETKEDVSFRGGSRGTTTLVENSNSLMRSGIVFAGANDVWNEENTNEEDGVLTAYEVSLLNLQNTKLTVLSACETGLGDIKGSEGVYGLQRAFRIAGAQQLIMSLWQVPDKETEEFMVLFYSNLLKLRNVTKAFAEAQKIMRGKYEPYFWGAFVLIE